MGRSNDTPFGRGETFYNGGTIDSNNLGGDEYQGMIKVFEDVDYSQKGVKTTRGVNYSGTRVTCRCVRNKSGITLYGKRLVQIDPANPGQVLGYANTLFGEAYPVDEFLPASGVPANDLFWIVVQGPAKILTPMTGAEFNTTSIAAGAVIGAGTTNGGSTATGTTSPAGRGVGFAVAAATTAGQFTDILNYAVNWVGKAISAMTSGQTNSDMLVDVRRPGGPDL